MRILVVGAGRMGSIRVTDLVADARVDRVLVTNRRAERAEALSAETGATALAWDRFGEAEVDAVVVAVGTDAHDHVLRTVLPWGVPVLCEKPVALTLDATHSMLDLAELHGSPMQIGFQRRFDDGIRTVRESIESGRVGTLYSITMTSHDIAPSPSEFIAGSGGIFRDLHVHDFDLVRWLTGSEIDTVYATKAVRKHRDYADYDDADVSAIAAVTTEGIQVIITGARHDALGHDVRLEVFGSGDSVAAGLNHRTPLRAVEDESRLNVDPYAGFVDRFRNAFRAETRAFVSFVGGDIANPCPPASAVESLRIAVACERSIESRSAVHVRDVI